MNHFAIRLWMTSALLIFGWLASAWVRSGNAFQVTPIRNLETFPTEFDGYQSKEIPLDERVGEVLRADAVLNRLYVRPDGASMMCHLAAWTSPSYANESGTPHPPTVCYPAAGWKIISENATKIETPSGRFKINILLVERDNSRSVVAYWYQIGNLTFTTAGDARQTFRKLWGKKHWPALTKVLLDTRAREIETALPQIEKFASTFFTWIQEN